MSESSPTAERYLPRIRELHRRHPGVTAALSGSFEEATAVCLSRRFTPPTGFSLSCDDRLTIRYLQWREPNERERRAWANDTDRVAAAAYGVSLAAVEAELDLIAIARTYTLSGADYYLLPNGQNAEDLENAVRLEVSGTESSETKRINRRLREKLVQVAHPNDPSLACVISFGVPKILLRRA